MILLLCSYLIFDVLLNILVYLDDRNWLRYRLHGHLFLPRLLIFNNFQFTRYFILLILEKFLLYCVFIFIGNFFPCLLNVIVKEVLNIVLSLPLQKPEGEEVREVSFRADTSSQKNTLQVWCWAYLDRNQFSNWKLIWGHFFHVGRQINTENCPDLRVNAQRYLVNLSFQNPYK